MNIKKIYFVIIALITLITSCGKSSEVTPIYLSGRVDISEITNKIQGPVLVLITSSDDLEELEADPMNTTIEITAADEADNSFHIDLSDKGLHPGDDIFIFAFVDNNYSDGIPYPDAGDYIGFYINRETLSTGYTLESGDNSDIEIEINRQVFSFDSEISGTVQGTNSGKLLVLAYAGEINSSDFTEIDFDKVIGYQRITKGDEPVQFTMKIIPYGYNVPIQNVYILALLDVNGNDILDAGDRIGIFSDNESGLPALITIEEGSRSDINIDFTMDIPEPSGYDISISGIFEKPAGYGADSKPVFIILARTDDPNTIFEDSMNSINYFYKMPAGENYFNADLSSTNLSPGDEVFVIALWDKDYTVGFPNPTVGDYTGFLQNKSSFSFKLTLQEGMNLVPVNGYEFKINKRIYSHNSSISFKLEEGNLPEGDYEGDNVILIAVQEYGYDSGNIDIDYVIGYTTVILDFVNFKSMDLFPAINENITVQNPFAIDNVYLFAVLDNKDDIANGRPDEGEYLGFYWKLVFFIFYEPDMFNLTDGENVFSGVEETVRFSDSTY